MNSSNSSEDDFLKKLTGIIEKNLINPQFGVSMLAKEMGVSRSGLHRKVNSIAKISVSQFINQIRLKDAMEMLRHTSFTVSEVAFKSGFSNTSYFIKCFHEYYGYTPGEVGNRDLDESNSDTPFKSRKKQLVVVAIPTVFVVALMAILTSVFNPFSHKQYDRNKSIAILPFKNYSNDSINGYLIDGLTESINNNLSKIKDLRVISRTSIEKYRDNPKLIREIAKELNVKYLVEGSGQKYGDEIFLTIQLIDAKNDMHLWSKQYDKNYDDIINLQVEVAKDIAKEIEVIITPEENKRIEKLPTENKKAYYYYLEGKNIYRKYDTVTIFKAIAYFEKAIEEDSTFALAYAEMADAYNFLYYLTKSNKDSNHFLANKYADKALFLNSTLPEAFYAKACYYYMLKEYEIAASYFKEALKYNPSYSNAIELLKVIYSSISTTPNAKEFLTYSLMAVNLHLPSDNYDNKSHDYYMLGAAFNYSGFFDEAKFYYNKALETDSQNIRAACEIAHLNTDLFIPFKEKVEYLAKLIELDSTNRQVLRICGLTYYWERDYNKAFYYFSQIFDSCETKSKCMSLDLGRMAVMLSHFGKQREAEEYMKWFSDFVENSCSDLDKCRLKAAVYAFNGDTTNALKQLKIFASMKNYPVWTIRVFKLDPMYDNICQIPEFKVLMSEMETKFWKNHKRVKASLENKGLL